MKRQYLFTSDRLGFRTWHHSDVELMAQINQDTEVMRYFPSVRSRAETADFVDRWNEEYHHSGFTYFAVDRLVDCSFIGFIGLHKPADALKLHPAIDVGWRLARHYWNQGFATEGARRCIRFGFESLALNKIVAIAPKVNLPSISVMEKAGMVRVGTFQHPLLLSNPYLVECVLYEITSAGQKKLLK